MHPVKRMNTGGGGWQGLIYLSILSIGLSAEQVKSCEAICVKLRQQPNTKRELSNNTKVVTCSSATRLKNFTKIDDIVASL